MSFRVRESPKIREKFTLIYKPYWFSNIIDRIIFYLVSDMSEQMCYLASKSLHVGTLNVLEKKPISLGFNAIPNTDLI